MIDCKNCKYAEIVRIGHLDLDVPDCQLDIPAWLNCRTNDYSLFEPKDITTED